jgi:hypothetical protein
VTFNVLAKEANWLATPKGPFFMSARLHWLKVPHCKQIKALGSIVRQSRGLVA